MVRKFKIEFDDWWEAILIIDEEKAAPIIKECVEFWFGWQRELQQKGGDYTRVFVEHIGGYIIEESMQNGLSAMKEKVFLNMEGYCMTLDGSNGIELVSMDEYQIDFEPEITELT